MKISRKQADYIMANSGWHTVDCEGVSYYVIYDCCGFSAISERHIDSDGSPTVYLTSDGSRFCLWEDVEVVDDENT